MESDVIMPQLQREILIDCIDGLRNERCVISEELVRLKRLPVGDSQDEIGAVKRNLMETDKRISELCAELREVEEKLLTLKAKNELQQNV